MRYEINGRMQRVDVVEDKHLECTVGGASKFWSVVVGKTLDPASAAEGKLPWVVILRWGKIGTHGQDQVNRFRSEYLARQYMAGRLKDKLNKGYVGANVDLHPKNKAVITPPLVVPYVETEWDLL